MQHYKCYFNYSYADISTDYPQSPENHEQAMADFLEDELANGWELASHGAVSSSGHPAWVFRAVGRNS